MNKRQVRGGVTGNRYSYSSGQPVFTIADADELQFHGEMEDWKPKFSYEHADGPSLVADSIDVVTGNMTAKEAASLTIHALQLHMNTARLTVPDLNDIRDAEAAGQNRVGALKLLDAWIASL